jgi:hypothetical protein
MVRGANQSALAENKSFPAATGKDGFGLAEVGLKDFHKRKPPEEQILPAVLCFKIFSGRR